MTRSILTSLTTFMALLVIYIVAAVYGISSVQSFALPMMVGIDCRLLFLAVHCGSAVHHVGCA